MQRILGQDCKIEVFSCLSDALFYHDTEHIDPSPYEAQGEIRWALFSGSVSDAGTAMCCLGADSMKC